MFPYMVKQTLQIDFIKDLEIGNYPGLSWWTQCNHKSPYKREAGESDSLVLDVRIEELG